MYGFESWTIKKAEHQRIDAFELRCWRRLLRVPWTARRSNQSILRKSVLYLFISPDIHWKDWCWSWNCNTLATCCQERTYWKRPWCWERLKSGGEGEDKWWDGWMSSVSQWTWVWVSSGNWWWTGKPDMLQFMGSQSQTRLSKWTELNCIYLPLPTGMDIFVLQVRKHLKNLIYPESHRAGTLAQFCLPARPDRSPWWWPVLPVILTGLWYLIIYSNPNLGVVVKVCHRCGQRLWLIHSK